MVKYLRLAKDIEFKAVQTFYWDLIDAMHGHDDTVGWKKGIYPTDEFLKESICRSELYIMDHEDGYAACVVVNNLWNEGYDGCPWGVVCGADEVLVPHALAVNPKLHGRGIGKMVIDDIINLARDKNKKAIRLDILKGNLAAKNLYMQAGFAYVQTKLMFYEDTGWTEYEMYELIL